MCIRSCVEWEDRLRENPAYIKAAVEAARVRSSFRWYRHHVFMCLSDLHPGPR